MNLSIFLAKLIGIYYLIITALWLLRKDQFEKGVRDLLSSNGLLTLTGAFQLLFGLAIAISHPVWELNWRGLITLLGYIAIVQGILRLIFPQKIKNFALNSLDKGYWILLCILAIIGIILTYHGFRQT